MFSYILIAAALNSRGTCISSNLFQRFFLGTIITQFVVVAKHGWNKGKLAKLRLSYHCHLNRYPSCFSEGQVQHKGGFLGDPRRIAMGEAKSLKSAPIGQGQ